jgi:hypothetical protein
MSGQSCDIADQSRKTLGPVDVQGELPHLHTCPRPSVSLLDRIIAMFFDPHFEQ